MQHKAFSQTFPPDKKAFSRVNQETIEKVPFVILNEMKDLLLADIGKGFFALCSE